MDEKKMEQEIPREEFGIEFGDVNGIKLYEVIGANRKERGKGEQKEKESKK